MEIRKIVLKTLEHQRPERIAMALPPPYPNDFCMAGPTDDPRHPETEWGRVDGERWERTDEWGNTWARIEGHSAGEVSRGVLENWELLETIELPDYDLPERYDSPKAAFAAEPEKFHVGQIGGFPFNIARKMRRLDNFLVDVLAEPEKIERLLGAVEERLHQAIRRLAEVGADAIMFAEDWGTQDRLLVSPQVWRRMFKPGFERLCRTAHGAGVYVFMHSCGHLHEVLDDMVETGIDVFQFDQPQLYGLDYLAEKLGGRATLWCPVDIQTTLQTRDPGLIERDAREMVEKLACGGGGFIAGYYAGNEAIGLDPAVQDIACRAFVEHQALR
jgi:hypothetical protein